jgi:WD40 repeat protein
MDFSPDGKYLAADGQDSVLLLDLDSEDEPRQLYRENKKRGIFVNPVFSPDGRMLAANCGTTRGFGMSYTVAHVWNTNIGELVLNKDDENHEIKDLWFLADGKRLAVLKFRRLEIWSLPGGEVEKDITLDVTCMYIRLSADGKTLYLFTGGLERRILFLDTETWTFTDPPFYFADAKASDDNLYFRFSPDDTLLAVAVEKEIRIWSFRDRKLVRTLSMTDWVADLAFSPDSCIMGATCHNFAHFWALQWNLAVPDSSGA